VDWLPAKLTDFYYLRLVTLSEIVECYRRDGWVLKPDRLVEPGARHRGSGADRFHVPPAFRVCPGGAAEARTAGVGFLILSRATLGLKATDRYGKVKAW
jgi:hypothetical protein